MDLQLNNTMRTVTGAVRCTRTDWLPVLSNIAPADIRKELATSKMNLRARGKPELPLLTDIDFHPRPRLKSRCPIWSNLPEEALTHPTPLAHTVAERNRRHSKQVLDQGPYHRATGNGPAPWPMEPAKQVPNGRGTMLQQHA